MKMNLRPYTCVAFLISVSLSLLALRIWNSDEACAMHVHNSRYTCLTLFSTEVSLIDEYHSRWKWIYAHAHTFVANLISVTCITHLETCFNLVFDRGVLNWCQMSTTANKKWIYAHTLALLFSLVSRYHCWLSEFGIETRRHVLCTCITHLDTCFNLVFDQGVLNWWVPQPMKNESTPMHILALLISLVSRYHCWFCGIWHLNWRSSEWTAPLISPLTVEQLKSDCSSVFLFSAQNRTDSGILYGDYHRQVSRNWNFGFFFSSDFVK